MATPVRVWILALGLCAAAPMAAQRDPAASAAAAFERGDLAAAERTLRAELRSNPNNTAALGMLGVVLDGAKKYAEAEESYRRALALSPRSPQLLNNFGNHLLAVGNAAAAREVFGKLLALDAAHANGNLQMARLELERKDGAEALRRLDRLPAGVRAEPGVALLRMQALYVAGRIAEADALLTSLTEAAPEDPRLQFSAGLALASAGRYEQAETFFTLALKAAPANFDVLYNLGLAASHAGHYARAHDVLEAALRQRPDDVDVLYGLATVEGLLKRGSAAVQHLAQAARLAPKRADVQLLLARTTFDMGYRADALIAYDRYLELAPGDETARRDRAFTGALAGLGEQSLKELETYVRRHPGEATGHYQFALALSAVDPERALPQFDKVVALDPDLVAARFARGVLNYRHGNPAVALADLEFAAARQPGNARILDRLGQTYMALERPADAERVLRRAAELAPSDSTMLLHLGRALAGLGRSQEARAVMERFRQMGTSEANRRKPSGLVQLMSLSPAELYAQYRARVQRDFESDPASAPAHVRYLKLLLDEGDTVQAAKVARSLLALDAKPALAAEAGRALLEAEQYPAAMELLDKASTAAPALDLDAAIATFHAAGAQAGLERLERVPQAARGGDFHLARAQMLDGAGRFLDAVAALNEALRAAPTRPRLYSEATLFLIKHDRMPEALRLLEQATHLLPDNPEILLSKATVLEISDSFEEAERLLNQIENRWPEWHSVWLAHGIILDTHKRYDEARQMLETAIALGARGPDAYFYLADATMRTSPERIDDAEKAVWHALKLAPADPWARALAGRIAFEKRDYQRAADLLREAVRQRPGFAQAHYHLAQALSALGLKEESKAELEELRRIRAEYPMADEAPADVFGPIFRVQPPRE